MIIWSYFNWFILIKFACSFFQFWSVKFVPNLDIKSWNRERWINLESREILNAFLLAKGLKITAVNWANSKYSLILSGEIVVVWDNIFRFSIFKKIMIRNLICNILTCWLVIVNNGYSAFSIFCNLLLKVQRCVNANITLGVVVQCGWKSWSQKKGNCG